jgi:xanthine dehydrogenase accessory factor
MQADDVAVLNGALDWLRAGHRVALSTVLRTWGSSPRPPGSLMAMNDSGRYLGSVSGGCVEESLIARYRDGEIAGPTPTLVDFGVDREQAARVGLPCGGRLEVMIEELDSGASIAELLAGLARGELVARSVDLRTGQVSLSPGNPGIECRVSDTAVVKTFGPAWQLLIIGDGQLARHLAEMACRLDYRVTICDPREDYQPAPPGDCVRYTHEMPDDAVHRLADQARTAVVALAHDPRQDDLGLSAALESKAFYIGALGSSRSAIARRKRLQTLGYTTRQIARIHGPAGLPIGSKRPAEIAVSILAEITATRNGSVTQEKAGIAP